MSNLDKKGPSIGGILMVIVLIIVAYIVYYYFKYKELPFIGALHFG